MNISFVNSQAKMIDAPFERQEFSRQNLSNAEIKRIHSSGSKSLKSNKQLPEQAIQLMNAWYAAHEDNPYPNRNDLDYLATHGGIKESQVKAWFSNKRNRTQNTHPKRARRYLARNQPTNFYEPQKIFLADRCEQRANFVLHSNYEHFPYSFNSLTDCNSRTTSIPNHYEFYSQSFDRLT